MSEHQFSKKKKKKINVLSEKLRRGKTEYCLRNSEKFVFVLLK